MNYQNIHDSIIERSKHRCILPYIYSERHHIIPKCMGGDDTGDNITVLLPEEHYIVHQLLTKLHPDNRGLVYACQMMSVSSKFTIRNNKLYRWIREKCCASLSEDHRLNISKSKMGKNNPMYGRNFSKEHRERIRNAGIGRKHKENTKVKIGDGNRGKIISEETKSRMSIAKSGDSNPWYGKTHSEETKLKISVARKDKPQKVIKCPYCDKSGGISNMYRYHFDNCKYKINYIEHLTPKE